MQFKVPQFLDIEDKIFGPFTFHQFVYLAGGAGLSYILFKWLGLVIALIPIVGIMALSLMLTFYRPNGKPFIIMLEASLKYFFQSKLYIWKREKATAAKLQTKPKEVVVPNMSRLTGNRLRDLAWSLDVLDSRVHLEK